MFNEMVTKKKRSVQDVPIFLDSRLFVELQTLVELKGWPYKTSREEYWLRDNALICLLLLTGLRVSEALSLRRNQFRVYEDRIILRNVHTLKGGVTRTRILLPKHGNLAYFTGVFQEWLGKVPSQDGYVFPPGGFHGFKWNKPLDRHRAWRIIKDKTDRFPHWFRGVCETIYGRIVFKSDAWKLKQFMGLKRLDSTSPYVKGSWEEDEHRIFEV